MHGEPQAGARTGARREKHTPLWVPPAPAARGAGRWGTSRWWLTGRSRSSLMRSSLLAPGRRGHGRGRGRGVEGAQQRGRRHQGERLRCLGASVRTLNWEQGEEVYSRDGFARGQYPGGHNPAEPKGALHPPTWAPRVTRTSPSHPTGQRAPPLGQREGTVGWHQGPGASQAALQRARSQETPSGPVPGEGWAPVAGPKGGHRPTF